MTGVSPSAPVLLHEWVNQPGRNWRAMLISLIPDISRELSSVGADVYLVGDYADTELCVTGYWNAGRLGSP